MKFYINIILLLFAITSNGQFLTGKIVDTKKDPIADVYVYNLQSTSHTHTSILGMFKIENTKVGDTLHISAIGFKNKKYRVQTTTNTNELQIVLEDQIFELEELIIQPGLDATRAITTINLETDPVNSSQEILQNVPGLFIGQHAGGGKAEQLFLRGFDIDHGTDVAISVDEMPVNMVSHAHGQGYADLHFVIPETIQYIDYEKGSYDVSKGNFATAGYVDFQTKERLEESSVSTTLANFNTTRSVGLIDILNHKKGQSAYIASEYLATDGPFESVQNFNRINLMGKYTGYLSNNNKLTASLSHFTSRWDASGQVPERAIAAGAISRFGAIDDTEGGETSRTNFILSYVNSVGANKIVTNNVFYTKYDFELYSNFTFFLNDPINGDQIRQKEARTIIGINRSLEQEVNAHTKIKSGLGLRNDQIRDIELSRTANRKTTLERVQLGTINETNLYGFGNISYTKDQWEFTAGARMDYFKFTYNDDLTESYETSSENAYKISPKFSTLYNANSQLQLFLKGGMGFHSNDTRLMAQQSAAVLPTSYNVDTGILWKPAGRLLINTNLWYLFLEDELIYVGDEGIVESGGATQRLGVDLGIRYQAQDWLFFNTDLNYAHARNVESPEGEDYIPLAPNLTMTAGMKLVDLKSFSGGIQARFLNDRPANEDNSIIAEGYVVTDINLNYQWKNINLGIAADNLFDTEWNETQFATTSRLENESEAVEEIHFTPGTPFQLKGTITYTF